MNTVDLLNKLLEKIGRYKILILLIGVLFAGIYFLKAKKTKPVYTSTATVFPLGNSSEAPISSSTLSGLLGMSQSTNNFGGSDASINIIELALSRNVREMVASSLVPELGNKTVTELLVNETNKNIPFWQKKIQMGNDSIANAVLGAQLLQSLMNAKINKNGVLELTFSNTDYNMITPVSNLIVKKISDFYINLKVSKATFDYNFLQRKIDSIKGALSDMDNRAVQMQQTTMFTPDTKLQYSLPKENLSDERQLLSRVRDIAINNREEALWRLQKATPIIAVLDKPNPPYDVYQPSALIQALIGFFLGILLVILIICSPILYRYGKQELSNKLVK